MIRAYSNKDDSKLVELVRKNTPTYFDPSEEIDFKNYLRKELEDYFVYEQNFEIIGAGGINYFPKEKLARISWDIVEPKCQGKGIGKELTQYRLNHLSRNKNIDSIVVRTTQLTYQFYEKMGFELEKVEKDFWAKNFDLYQMRKTNRINAG